MPFAVSRKMLSVLVVLGFAAALFAVWPSSGITGLGSSSSQAKKLPSAQSRAQADFKRLSKAFERGNVESFSPGPGKYTVFEGMYGRSARPGCVVYGVDSSGLVAPHTVSAPCSTAVYPTGIKLLSATPDSTVVLKNVGGTCVIVTSGASGSSSRPC